MAAHRRPYVKRRLDCRLVDSNNLSAHSPPNSGGGGPQKAVYDSLPDPVCMYTYNV